MTITLSKARLAALLVPFLLYFTYLRWYFAKWASLGEQLFLQHQRARFEAYYADGGGIGIHVYAALMTVSVIVISYELTAALLSRWFNRKRPALP